MRHLLLGLPIAALSLAGCAARQAQASGPYICQQSSIVGRLAQEDCRDPSGRVQVHVTAFLGATDTGRVDLSLSGAGQGQAQVDDIAFSGNSATVTVPPRQPDGTSNGKLAGLSLVVTRENAWTYAVTGQD